MTADTYTSRLGALLQGTGNNNNAWGADLNVSTFSLFDTAIAGYVSVAVTGGTLDYSSGTIPPAGASQRPEMILEFTGTLASNQIVKIPNTSKLYVVKNTTVMSTFTFQFEAAGGSASAAIPNGWSLVWCDGNENIYVGLSTSLRDVQWLGSDGTLAAPGISFASEPGSGFRRVSAGVLALNVGGTDILTISAAGINVASGTANVGGIQIIPSGVEVDFAGIFVPTGWYLEYGQAVARSGDANLLNAITAGFTGTTNGTLVITSVSADLRNLGLEGSKMEGTGVGTGCIIASVDSATQITLSGGTVTGSASGVSLRAFPYGNGDASTTFNLPDARGTVAAGRDNMGGTAANVLTTAGGNVNGISLAVLGQGAQNITLTSAQIPAHTHPNVLNESPHSHTVIGTVVGNSGSGSGINVGNGSQQTGSSVTGITITNNVNTGGGGSHFNVQPTRIRNVMIKR